MFEFKGIRIPDSLQEIRKAWLTEENRNWILRTRNHVIARFAKESDAKRWWNQFEESRGFNPSEPRKCLPPKRRTKNRLTKGNYRQTLARINQGRYDTETKLLRLLVNAQGEGNETILKAIKQRLKVVAPKIYRQEVGPLKLRDPLGSKTCYCAVEASIREIANAIIKNQIPTDAFLCDACWKEDICYAWGVFGSWGKKQIPKRVWTEICRERGDLKYAGYAYFVTIPI